MFNKIFSISFFFGIVAFFTWVFTLMPLAMLSPKEIPDWFKFQTVASFSIMIISVVVFSVCALIKELFNV